MDVRAMLEEEDRTWHVLLGVFHRIPSQRFEVAGVTPDGWSPKDVMFHVAVWLADCARVCEQIREGTFDRLAEDAKVIEVLNRGWFELSRTMEPSDVRAGFEASRLKAREGFATLSLITPDAWEWFEESGPLHYRHHAADLEAWLG